VYYPYFKIVVIIDHHNVIIRFPTRRPTLVGIIIDTYFFLVTNQKISKTICHKKINSWQDALKNSFYTYEMTSQLNIIYQLSHPWSIAYIYYYILNRYINIVNIVQGQTRVYHCNLHAIRNVPEPHTWGIYQMYLVQWYIDIYMSITTNRSTVFVSRYPLNQKYFTMKTFYKSRL